MSTSRTSYQNLIPWHLKEFQTIIVKEGPSIETILKDLKRSSCKNFLGTHQKNSHTRTSAQRLQDLNERTSWGGCQQDLYKIFSRGIVQDLDQDLRARTLRESHKIVIKGPAAAGEDLVRSWDENLPRASQKSFHTSTSKTWHLQNLHARTCWWGSNQDLRQIFWQGLVQDHARTLQGHQSSHKDLPKFMQGPHQDLHNIFSQDLGQKPHTLRTFKTPPTLARSP